MSLEAQYRAIYQLMYKRRTRDAFQQGKFRRFDGLDDAEAEQVRKVASLRQDVVVQLHANDIGTNWYMPRFPATWIALQVALDCDQAELTMRFTDSAAFETRLNDDSDGRALAGFVDELAARDEALKSAGWMPELLRYERMVRGHWPDEVNPRVEAFGWDVGGIADALLEKELFPVDEVASSLHLLLYRDDAGVSEIALSADQARVMRKVLNHLPVDDEPPKFVAKCRRVLNQLRS